MENKILLVSERSAGHIYPALAVAEKIKTKNARNKVFIFVTSGFLKEKVKSKGYSTLGRVFSFRNILIEFFWRLPEAIYILFKVRPAWVIGFGGRDSFFLVLLSCFLVKKKKVFIYEPNRKMGRANKVLSWFVPVLLRGLPPEDRKKNHKRVGIIPGKDRLKISKKEAFKKLGFDQKPVVLCFGGSQGSSFINKNFMRYVSENKQDSYQIIHLTGARDFSEAALFYEKIENKKFIKDFYEDMSLFYSAADVVVCRAGAFSLADISFYGLPAILIPHPEAGGHQGINAAYLEEKGAAVVFSQRDFSFEDFNICLKKLIGDSNFYSKIKENLNKIKLYGPEESLLNFLKATEIDQIIF